MAANHTLASGQSAKEAEHVCIIPAAFAAVGKLPACGPEPAAVIAEPDALFFNNAMPVFLLSPWPAAWPGQQAAGLHD